jgi:tRNA pseudouridine55 synthase
MGTPTSELGGVLLVDKPAGVTSHDVVAIVRRSLHIKKAGHTGTLDPFATGLVVVLIGRGTRLLPYVEQEPKVYETTIRFGAETDTDDVTGALTRSAPLPDSAAVDDAIAQLSGRIEQVPPDFSAKQVDGKRAYAAARRGAPLALRPVTVTVNAWHILARDADTLTARVTCGGGTYIRALARDLGRLSGSAAHLLALRRTSAGPFSVAHAATLDDVQRGAATLLPLTSAVPSLPVQRLGSDELERVVHGNAVASRTAGPRVALVTDDDSLIAVAETEGGELRPKLVLRDA